ncbi:MAG: hypothetical protein A2698_00120 [Candidatus Levybacteria bacterium RIFCSPHIGHO2_01_FULL_42_15]|nr:MAG: hypothetical protein A2698_00120 [Candidatus Levybacteria bacterium RIFCSPHIGHO2_01_FULL_42_15]
MIDFPRMRSALGSIINSKDIILGKKNILVSISKRQRLIASVIILSVGLFLSEHFFGKTVIYATIVIALLSNVFLYLSLKEDLKGNMPIQIFILPFFFSLAFGFFYFLIPARFLTRVLTTGLYAVGLYSLFLSQNIFIVSSIRTIALLSSARIVSFVLTILSYFFLANIVFSLHLLIVPTSLLIFTFSWFLVIHSLWTYTLEKTLYPWILWALAISLCLFEASFMLWFWPSNPTVIALFLTGFFYAVVGLSHVWVDKRLFKGVLWEYVWVGAIVLFVLVAFTNWGQ